MEPALAFQLELSRMRNFYLTAVPCANHKMHLYLGAAKVKEGLEVTDHRFFIRAIIRHSDLITKVRWHGCLHPTLSSFLMLWPSLPQVPPWAACWGSGGVLSTQDSALVGIPASGASARVLYFVICSV